MTTQELFEKLYREQSTLPAFMVDDHLVKGADGEFWHLTTRIEYKWFLIGLTTQVNDHGKC